MTGISRREYLMQLLFPPRCLLCGDILPIQCYCERCAREIESLRRTGDSANLTRLNGRALGALDGVCASFVYADGIADAVARYKFRGERSLGRDMSALMAGDFLRVFSDAALSAGDFFTIGVPSKEINNDHAQRLADSCGRILKMKRAPNLLIKIRRTERQHELGADKRASNLAGAFSVRNSKRLAGASVLLVDDVITSGHTLGECAATLRAAGVANVYGLAFCATADRQ
ncbi:MAG: phosphoribosyltransferase family protein [Oscillospiraceae bacterium]